MLDYEMNAAFRLSALISVVVSLSGCGLFQSHQKLPAENCKDLVCFQNYAIGTINNISLDIDYWASFYTWALVITIILGAIATVMLGLQGDNNKHWTRPVGLVATTFGAAMTTLVTSFHVQDNVDKLIDVRSHVTTLVNQLEHNIKKAKPEEFDEIYFGYSQEFGQLMNELGKLKGSAGRLNIGTDAARASKETPASK